LESAIDRNVNREKAMKKLGFVLLLVAALALPAMAGQVSIGPGYGPYQTGSGGEFTFTPLLNSLDLSGYGGGATNVVGAPGSFETFCIEGGEYIYPDSTYDFALSNGSIYTGVPVSQGAGWLYSQFATGNWQNGLTYNYGANRTTSAALLQNAIWWLEGQENIAYDGTNPFMAAVVAQFGSQAGALAAGGGSYGVYALNLWVPGEDDTLAGARQDMLFYAVPDGGMTLMLLGGALVGIGALRRKFRL
jgi:hypothetical protein